MSQPTSFNSAVRNLRTPEVEGFDALRELALDLQWSWFHWTDEIWTLLDTGLWEITHNPWVILQTVSADQLEQVIGKPEIRKKIDEQVQARRRIQTTPAWFQKSHPEAPINAVAYFSMEFMLSEALPIYSDGLGNVAGDQLKAASDPGVPLVGIGLLYQQGYFRQMIDKDGAQQALFPYNDPGQLPIQPLRSPEGEWLRLELALPGYSVWLRVWEVQVGRLKLYLLDSNDAANSAIHRGITSELYSGGPELRLKQELVLGIGGWRLMEALKLQPDVCHLNEGHAAFTVLERARWFMTKNGRTFDEALAATRAGNLFTTHTAVPAGFDRFSPSLMHQYLAAYAQNHLHIAFKDLMALGRANPSDDSEPFNMAYLAIRGSGRINGVSRLHGQVSRHLLGAVFPRWPEEEVPIGYLTNGVHMRNWDSPMADAFWTETCGKDRWLGSTDCLESKIRNVPDARLWDLRSESRHRLIEYARRHLAQQLTASGFGGEAVKQVASLFDPNVLTMGFARRFATYKRPNLLLHDPERLLRILNHPMRPVQLIIAGKAHPDDEPGRALILQWTRFIRETPGARQRVVFLNDYDMHLSAQLVQGVDVWINTPRRPWEACGTSGMKVLVNGGLNLSELDGWWAEAYAPQVGWALGDGQEHHEDPAWDAAEADALYRLLEDEVVPEFYTRDQSGVPTGWIARMRESMARLTPRFSANRVVRQYTEEHYLPAAARYRERAADQGASGVEALQWKNKLDQKWGGIRFAEVHVDTQAERHHFEGHLYLDDLPPGEVRVELYADGQDGAAAVREEMTLAREMAGSIGGFVFQATVPAARPASDYTPRVIPRHSRFDVPLECPRITWWQGRT